MTRFPTPSGEMIERVAKAIWFAEAISSKKEERWAYMLPFDKEPHLAAGRAAIEAMRICSIDMSSAGDAALRKDKSPYPADVVWSAMISAALSQAGEG